MRDLILYSMAGIGFVLIVLTYQLALDIQGRLKVIGERRFPVSDE